MMADSTILSRLYPLLKLNSRKILSMKVTLMLHLNQSMLQLYRTYKNRNVVVITTAQLHSTKPELRFCAGSNPARGMLEIHHGEDL